MKYIIVILLLLRYSDTYATITPVYDTVGTYWYTPVQHVSCGIGADTVTRMGMTIAADNGVSQCVVSVLTYSNSGVLQCTMNEPMNGTDYTGYRDICPADTFARLRYVYEFIHTKYPSLTPTGL